MTDFMLALIRIAAGVAHVLHQEIAIVEAPNDTNAYKIEYSDRSVVVLAVGESGICVINHMARLELIEIKDWRRAQDMIVSIFTLEILPDEN